MSLKPVTDFTSAEWRVVYRFFRDRELADWNDAKPIRMPEFMFRKIMQDEEKAGDRVGFGVLSERGEVIGNAELYDFRPSPPLRATTATLGVMIGLPALWGQGYGREAVGALLTWAFTVPEPPLQRVRLTTFGHNRRAQRAFAASGFKEVGRSEKVGRTDVHMEITREAWLERPAP